jgi:cell division septation protein DedD
MRYQSRIGLLVLFGGLFADVTPCALVAQAPILPTTPQLQEVVRLAQEGYGDSARAVVARIAIRTPTTDPVFPEVLFTAATVARTGDEMRANFTKIVIDYPISAWADKALLRLAQLDYGGGKLDGTIEKVSRFFTDYPTSPLLPAAALWGARAAFDRHQMQQACDWLTRGIAAVGSDVELRNQLVFAKQRCVLNPGAEMAPVVAESVRVKPPEVTKPAAPARDTAVAKAPAAPKPAAAASKPTASPWRVQVAAIADKTVIARLVKKIEAAGFTAYKVAGPRGLTKIQAGPFTSREKAKAALPRIKTAVGGSPIIAQAP